MSVLARFESLRSLKNKAWAGLLDPDESLAELPRRLEDFHRGGAAFVFIGGSYTHQTETAAFVQSVRTRTVLPVVLFPGDVRQIVPADALLFLSLISGRNADYLIGRQVEAAPMVKKLALDNKMEIVPTGYMLFDTGRPTTAGYITATPPLPPNKPSLAAYTALAGQYLGLKTIYMDAGSGAESPLPTPTITAVSQTIDLPLIVGGGIDNAHKAEAILKAGADVLVIGTALEHPNPRFVQELKSLFL